MSEQLNVDHAFDPEARRAQADINAYTASRPYKSYNHSEEGLSHLPDGTYLENPDVHFDAARSEHEAKSQEKYEDMKISTLARKLGEATYYGDGTSMENISKILDEKIDEFAPKLGRETEPSSFKGKRTIALRDHDDRDPATGLGRLKGEVIEVDEIKHISPKDAFKDRVMSIANKRLSELEELGIPETEDEPDIQSPTNPGVPEDNKNIIENPDDEVNNPEEPTPEDDLDSPESDQENIDEELETEQERVADVEQRIRELQAELIEVNKALTWSSINKEHYSKRNPLNAKSLEIQDELKEISKQIIGPEVVAERESLKQSLDDQINQYRSMRGASQAEKQLQIDKIRQTEKELQDIDSHFEEISNAIKAATTRVVNNSIKSLTDTYSRYASRTLEDMAIKLGEDERKGAKIDYDVVEKLITEKMSQYIPANPSAAEEEAADWFQRLRKEGLPPKKGFKNRIERRLVQHPGKRSRSIRHKSSQRLNKRS